MDGVCNDVNRCVIYSISILLPYARAANLLNVRLYTPAMALNVIDCVGALQGSTALSIKEILTIIH